MSPYVTHAHLKLLQSLRRLFLYKMNDKKMTTADKRRSLFNGNHFSSIVQLNFTLLNGDHYKFLLFKIIIIIERQPHTKQKKVHTAGRAGPKETDYSA